MGLLLKIPMQLEFLCNVELCSMGGNGLQYGCPLDAPRYEFLCMGVCSVTVGGSHEVRGYKALISSFTGSR